LQFLALRQGERTVEGGARGRPTGQPMACGLEQRLVKALSRQLYRARIKSQGSP
jgi:hypothetical protein